MEYWDIYDAQGRTTGCRVKKGEPLSSGAYHLAMEAWIVNGRGEILIQQRSQSCEILPGIWGLTTGRMMAGESSRQGCIREIREELGLRIALQEPEFLRRIVRGDGTQLIWDIYRVRRDVPPEGFVLQAAEVARVAWVAPGEFRRRLAEGTLFRYPEILEVLSAVSA